MATRKQVAEDIEEWLRLTKCDVLEDEDLDIEEELDFFIDEYLFQYGLCNGCRWYFKPDRTCEKTTESRQCCMNKVHRHWVDTKKKGSKDG